MEEPWAQCLLDVWDRSAETGMDATAFGQKLKQRGINSTILPGLHEQPVFFHQSFFSISITERIARQGYIFLRDWLNSGANLPSIEAVRGACMGNFSGLHMLTLDYLYRDKDYVKSVSWLSGFFGLMEMGQFIVS